MSTSAQEIENLIALLSKHNSLGYRGEEIVQPKPKGVFRIVALGGSTTYGEGVRNYKETYPYLLEKVLKKRFNYSNVEVINAGVGGYNSWESLINLQFRVLDLNPDMIIIYHGTNDVHTRLVNPKYYKGDNSGRRTSWTEVSEPFFFKSSVVRFVITKLTGFSLSPSIGRYVTAETAAPYLTSNDVNNKLGGTPIQTININTPEYFKRNLDNMVAIAKQQNISVLLATWAYNTKFKDYASVPHYIQGFEENNKVVMGVGKKNNISVFDFEGMMLKDIKYWSDGRHLNKEGNLIKAYLFAEFIHTRTLVE